MPKPGTTTRAGTPPGTAGLPRRVRKDQLASDVWAGVGRLTMEFHRRLHDAAQRLRLTPGEMRALQTLEEGNALSMRHLADAWECDASNVTWIVDRLEARGLVRRDLSAEDRRVRTVTLTKKGEAARRTVAAIIDTPPASLLRLTTTELTTLARLLDTLGDGEHRPCGPGCGPTR